MRYLGPSAALVALFAALVVECGEASDGGAGGGGAGGGDAPELAVLHGYLYELGPPPIRREHSL